MASVIAGFIVVMLLRFDLVCSTATLTYSMDEELPIGTLVADVRRDASWLTARHPPEVFNTLRFGILRNSGASKVYFTVDEISGEIRTASIIDRESICAMKSIAPCVLRIDIGVTPIAYFDIIRAEVTIVDVNDNMPVFNAGNSFQLMIVESSPVGSTFSLPVATDADSGENGLIEYQSSDESGNFRLVYGKSRRSGVDADDIKLKLVRQLDREEKTDHQLFVLATDRGRVIQRTGTLTVDVIVGDVNDNAPRFERQSYEVGVPEDAPIGTTLLRMRANDPDLGENAQVRYRFSTRSQSTYGDVFAIDPTMGDVVLLQSLAYGPSDPVTLYHLSIVAEDGGPIPTPAHASLVVKVIDVNDHSPRIAVDASVSASDSASGVAPTQPEVAENSPAGTFVGHVTATDADTGANGVVRCDIVPPSAARPADFRLVAVYEGEYQLLTVREFDRETSARQFAAIRCSDGGTPARVTTRNVTVLITDQNDNAPVFSTDIYETTVPENSPWGTSVTRLAATDSDTGENGRVTFALDRRESMGSPSSRRFNVDPDTGVITTLVGLDRESTELIEFGVVAMDAGSSSSGGRQMARAVVRVHVSDVDDESPTFVHNDFSFSVGENLAVGTTVGRVSAVDLDSSPYNAFSYRLRNADTEPDSTHFRVDPESGTITTAAVFDRERRAIYRMSIIAQSDTVSARADVTDVTVRITDVNDNVPRFVFPDDVNNTVVVSLSFKRALATSDGRMTVVQCKATDADDELNGRLIFDIVDDVIHPGMFQIDRFSGRVTMVTDKVPLRNGGSGNMTFDLLLRVSDDGSPSLSNVQTLFVVLVDNDVTDYEDIGWMKSMASNDNSSSSSGLSLFDTLIEWMAGGGVIVVAACLAGLATVIALLSVAVCVVRSKHRGRGARCRSPGTQLHPITKVELLPLSGSGSDEVAADHPLLDPQRDKISGDVTMRQFESEPIRYATIPYSNNVRVTSLADVKTTSEHDTDSGCADVSNSDDCGSNHGSNSSAEMCAAVNKDPNGVDTRGVAMVTIDLTMPPTVVARNCRPGHHVFDVHRESLPPANSTLVTPSSTLGGRKTVRFADDKRFDSGTCPRPASGEYLSMPTSVAATWSNSPSHHGPTTRGYGPTPQLTSFVSVGESTGSPL